MYLSRMELNPARRGTHRLLANPQSMHAAVLAAFPHGSESRPLWRVDRGRDGTYLYVVSSGRPSFEHLQEQAGWSQQMSWQTRDYDEVLHRLQRGQQFAFRLTANPSHTVTFSDGRKQRLAHVTATQQASWLVDRVEGLGIELLRSSTPELVLGDVDASDAVVPEWALTVSERSTLRFPRNGKTVTLGTARFDGALEVVDVDLLRRALVSGVGRGKAYGCGLLTLAPLSTLR